MIIQIAEIPWMLGQGPHVCDNQFAALVLSNNLLKKKRFLPMPGKF
jgi:hypothetical protein